MAESDRLFVEAALVEGTQDRARKEVVVDLIREGFGNKRDNHYYSRKVLEGAAEAFEGAKMYIDHLDPDTQRKLAGMPRSVKDLGGRILETELVTDDEGRTVIRGVAKIAQPWLWELIENDPGLLGVSINAWGKAKPGTVEGRQARIVEGISKVGSVDWVTEAGAGGKVVSLVEAQLEQEEEPDMDSALERLEEERPDLYEELVAMLENDEDEDVDAVDDEDFDIEDEVEDEYDEEDEDLDDVEAEYELEFDEEEEPAGVTESAAFEEAMDEIVEELCGTEALMEAEEDDELTDEDLLESFLEEELESGDYALTESELEDFEDDDDDFEYDDEVEYVEDDDDFEESEEEDLGGELEDLEEYIEARAQEIAEANLVEAVAAAVKVVQEQYEDQMVEMAESMNAEIAQREQRERAGSLIESSDLSPATKAALKAEFHDSLFEAVVNEDGEVVVEADEVLTRAVREAIDKKRSELSQYSEGGARVTGAGESGATTTGSARLSEGASIDNDIDRMLGIA